MDYVGVNRRYFGSIHDLAEIQRAAFPIFKELGIGADRWRKRGEFLKGFNDQRFSGVDPQFLAMAVYFLGAGEEAYRMATERMDSDGMSPEARDFLTVLRSAATTKQHPSEFICSIVNFCAESQEMHPGKVQRYLM